MKNNKYKKVSLPKKELDLPVYLKKLRGVYGENEKSKKILFPITILIKRK